MQPQRITFLFGINVLDRAQYGLIVAIGGRIIKVQSIPLPMKGTHRP